MAQRDMKKTAARVRGVQNDYYSISLGELRKLAEMAKNGDIFEAFSICFDYGYVLGARAQKAGKYKEKTSAQLSASELSAWTPTDLPY